MEVRPRPAIGLVRARLAYRQSPSARRAARRLHPPAGRPCHPRHADRPAVRRWRSVRAPFTPEQGAYAGGGHGHGITAIIATTTMIITITGTIIIVTMTMLIDGALPPRCSPGLSPSYPVGAFTYSHGLETAVDDGRVRDVAGLVDYIDAVLVRGGGWADAVLFVHGWRAAGDAGRAGRDRASWPPPSARAARRCWRATSRAAPSSPSHAAPGRIRRSMPLRSGSAGRTVAHAVVLRACLCRACRSAAAGAHRLSPRHRPPTSSRPACGWCRSARRTADRHRPCWRRPDRGDRRPRLTTPLDDLGTGRASAGRRCRCTTKRSTRGCSAHDLPARPAPHRHRRPGRLRQDRADRPALQGDARRL